MITLRSFRTGAGLFVLLGFSFASLYLLSVALKSWRYGISHTPLSLSPLDIQAAAYNRLTSLPLSTSIDLAYGSLALSHRRICHPFLFPRPTSTLFVTAWPNHGAGLGHQFGEWLYGPAIAMMLNISYAHTGVLGNSARWDGWLGFGAGEDTEADVQNMATDSRQIVRTDTAHYLKDNPLTIEDWIRIQIAEHRAMTLNHSLASLPSSPSQPHPGQLTADPVTHVTLLRIYRVHVPWPSRRYSCHPDINLLLRRKYCAARIRLPVKEDLYREDREAGKTVIAFHLRCGDSCFNIYRATALDSVIHTIRLITDTLSQGGLPSPSFHLFSQPPQNDSAENHFRPVMESEELKGVPLTSHWYTHSHTTLHHLVTADVLIGAQSSFSWIASLLHHTVALGPVDTCRWQVGGV